ncbi:M1 family metallopeptidase [Mucilaginibacter sp. UR6-11]|uniref:M1 family metallopeptidase n=1 Tax=Mucilaginibacter sp. UR6-11 TaxID=1435644 RepID=UPI001E4372D7|nr:M1 family metallopeptidase [Mucilaginibacter sp. UR6-11]MCC8424545.1 M1 family metallopeptidase [Mucilaginibacter sp. UR6-11]
MNKLKIYFVIGYALATLSARAQAPDAAIDVLHYGFNIRLNDVTNDIRGRADITVKFLKTPGSIKINLVKKNAKGLGMVVTRVLENGKQVRFHQDSDAVNILTRAVQHATKTYTIIYGGIPADGLIISTNKFGHRTFFGDNWPNRAHNWIPCVDNPADKASLDFKVTAPDHYQVVANGLKTSEAFLPGHLKVTRWVETAQLPTKVMVIGVADFAVDHPKDVNDIPVYTYVFPENAQAGFRSYAVAGEILPFFIAKIGPYAYKKLANVQSKTIFGGMENASAIFYFENSVDDKGIEELMAHEIAHQWFGDAVSEKDFHHLWLSEGFATYLTNYYLENKYGEDTLKKCLATQRAKVLKFEKYRFTPVVDTTIKTDYMPLLNANSYEKGSWVLHMLRRKLGDGAFWKGINTYYLKYGGSNANTTDFKDVMSQISGQNLDLFFKQWLNTAGHPDLAIKWSYDNKTHIIDLTVDQQQNNLYTFPLEVAIDGQVNTINITEKLTVVHIAADKKLPVIEVDPNVNLMASFTVTAD